MKLRVATADDDAALKEFFTQMPLPGAIDFSISRRSSFFDHYRLLSNDFETLILEDDNGSIAGLASLVFRRGLVLGEDVTWAYATDLRIAPTRRALSQWAQHYVPILERAMNEHGCKYVFSAVEQNDRQAYNAFVRPTSHSKRNLPRYLLVNRFRLVTLHGRLPLSDRPLATLNLSPLTASHIDEVCAYLRSNNAQRPIAFLHTPEEFFSDLARWPGLSLSDFRVARDLRGRIRGVAALYDPRATQILTPLAYHGFAQTIHQLLGVASWSRLVRPLPKPGSPLQIRFLTHLACDSSEVFHSLIDDAFSRLPSTELLSYVHFKGNWRTLPPKAFVATSLPFGLYQVLSPGWDTRIWPTPGLETFAPEFEAAWL